MSTPLLFWELRQEDPESLSPERERKVRERKQAQLWVAGGEGKEDPPQQVSCLSIFAFMTPSGTDPLPPTDLLEGIRIEKQDKQKGRGLRRHIPELKITGSAGRLAASASLVPPRAPARLHLSSSFQLGSQSGKPGLHLLRSC